jgi:hypothetical protein
MVAFLLTFARFLLNMSQSQHVMEASCVSSKSVTLVCRIQYGPSTLRSSLDFVLLQFSQLYIESLASVAKTVCISNNHVVERWAPLAFALQT